MRAVALAGATVAASVLAGAPAWTATPVSEPTPVPALPAAPAAAPIINAAVVPVPVPAAERSPFAGMDWGVSMGFATFGSVDGNLRSVGRDLGMRSPPGPVLLGLAGEAWLAPVKQVRVNVWWLQLSDSRTAAFAPAGETGGDREQTLTASLRGGGIGARYVAPLKHGAVWAGGDFGLARLRYALERVRLGGAGSFDALTDSLANAVVVDTYRRDLSTGGPLFRGAIGADWALGRWFALGLQGGYTALITPQGQWVDNNTGENLVDPPFNALQSWDVRAQVIVGAVTRK